MHPDKIFLFSMFFILGLDLTDVFQEVRNKKQLAVRCGKMAGCLYRIKYDNGKFWEVKKIFISCIYFHIVRQKLNCRCIS